MADRTSLIPATEGYDVENPAASASVRASVKVASTAVSDYSSDPTQQSENALLIKVLRGMRQSPISLKDFQEYLDSERSGELSKFFVDAEKHEAKAQERVPQAVTLAHDITDHYIKMNAEEEINISDQDRRKILGKLEENEEAAAYDPTLFRAAKGEVIKMLSGDKFQRFLKRQLETNINQKEVTRRKIMGISLTALSLIIVGILMWVQTFAATPFNVRWWRLIVFPLLVWGIGLVLSSRAQVCSGLAGKCVRMRENESWFSAYRKDQGTQVVQDELALSRIMKKAKEINRGAVLYSIALIVVLILLPPGYGILVEG